MSTGVGMGLRVPLLNEKGTSMYNEWMFRDLLRLYELRIKAHEHCLFDVIDELEKIAEVVFPVFIPLYANREAATHASDGVVVDDDVREEPYTTCQHVEKDSLNRVVM